MTEMCYSLQELHIIGSSVILMHRNSLQKFSDSAKKYYRCVEKEVEEEL